ncbi:hypothetical protein EDB87DRAFT_1290604 [Lactarius vividus]|nr:hypothetical protein EDB87DRAFT_1290604 [Lactarius vividus]
MQRHVQLRSTRSFFEHSRALLLAALIAHISALEPQLTFTFLTSDLRSQESCDVHAISEKNKACEKKQPQGRIVDFLKKQAQQPPAGKGSGLRPLGAPLSGNTRKLEGPSKASTLSDSFPAVLGNRHHLGKCDYTEAVDSTRQLHNTPCDADPLSTSRRAIHTKMTVSSNTMTDSRFSISGNCATQSSGAPQSGSRFQESSTRASISQSLLGSCIVGLEHSPAVLHGPAIPPQHQALPASRPRLDVSSSPINPTSTSIHDDSATLRTFSPLELPTQKAMTPALANANTNESTAQLSSQNRASIKKVTKLGMTPSTAQTSWTSPACPAHSASTPFAPPQASTHRYAQEPSVIEIPGIRHNMSRMRFRLRTDKVRKRCTLKLMCHGHRRVFSPT